MIKSENYDHIFSIILEIGKTKVWRKNKSS